MACAATNAGVRRDGTGSAARKPREYVDMQPKLRSGTDSPAGKSGLECNHNISLLSEDTPLLSQESPHKRAFFLFGASLRAQRDG